MGFFDKLNPFSGDNPLQQLGGALFDILNQMGGQQRERKVGKADSMEGKTIARQRGPQLPYSPSYGRRPGDPSREQMQQWAPRFRKDSKQRSGHMGRYFSPEERRQMGYE